MVEIGTQAFAALWLWFFAAKASVSHDTIVNVVVFKVLPAAIGTVLGCQAYLAWAVS